MDDPRARELREIELAVATTPELFEIERAVAPTLDDGLDDWVPVDTLIWNAIQVVPKDSDRFAGFFATVLDYLLREGLMIVGDIGDTGFEPWTSSIEDTVERVTRDCQAVDWAPQGSLCWLSNTPKGDQRAR
ncbi:hypothetical protein [Amycolatopsis keratiniphila]|uniref:hypothetical protein n=1 Tax=Amycolatopsis keratiniphila TaxID=129921 RepID=UPI00087C5204|nr:hypothetical protein [Amycolatopsis keratiniphila]OLZ47245.1 hypothetical protein BS330_34810 [Amycolatopsis keratiniphila subsp. nogabecina]SDU38833.1 hypothetical protein SAMN04489733_3657 [Amycolatopsis keratiniphila]